MAAQIPNFPIVNLGNSYVNGLQLTWLTGTTMFIGGGQARDSTDINDILLSPAGCTINVAVQGINGIDQGTIAASTFYYVYVIGDSTAMDTTSPGYVPTAGLISLSATNPALPANYDMFRRIGTVLTSSGSVLLAFRQLRAQAYRKMWYDTSISVLAATAAAAFTAQSLAVAVPPIATEVGFRANLLPNAAGNFVELRPTGSSSAAGYVQMSGDVAAVHHIDTISCPCNATPSIDWVTDAASTVALNVEWYLDPI